jgi:hypothetical protein
MHTTPIEMATHMRQLCNRIAAYLLRLPYITVPTTDDRSVTRTRIRTLWQLAAGLVGATTALEPMPKRWTLPIVMCAAEPNGQASR